ncbi:MAG: carbohydrate ABC transporter permease [Bifidobacteriaceae bacterium]|jgi:multiple sugar transport system permease protein|nr:carbohydrate ABC transporter permease [Bifidobacteriaceae bacterium]
MRRSLRLLGKTGNTVLGLSCALAVLLPILWIVSAAVRPNSDITAFPPTLIPRELTFENFIEVFERLPFARLYGNTLAFAGIATAVSLTLDTLAGYALARLPFRGSNVILGMIVVLLMLPFQVTLVPLYELMQKLDLVGTLPGLILPRITSAFGIFFMRQFFLSLPADLEDAGRIDGASEWRIFRSLMLPLSRPALLTLGLFHFQAYWNDLIWPLIMSNRLENATLPAGLAMFAGQATIEYSLTMAGSLLALTPLVVVFLLVQRTFVQSIATTGGK